MPKMVKNIIEKQEIDKWLSRIEGVHPRLSAGSEKGESILKNISAYISDSKHFLEEGDYVNSFEAVIWAWAWYEIGRDLGLVVEKS